jgi:hypothetical protein
MPRFGVERYCLDALCGLAILAAEVDNPVILRID